jgi:hypothetical protein
MILFMDHNLDQERNMKLLLSFFNSYLVLRLTSIKVKSSTLGKLRMMNCNMRNFLDVRETHTPLNIWEFLCTIEN